MTADNKLLRALALTDQVIQITREIEQPRACTEAELLKSELRSIIDMRQVVSLIPGANMTERAKAAGVTRQTLHRWLTGIRPMGDAAERLEKLTGIPAEQIRRLHDRGGHRRPAG